MHATFTAPGITFMASDGMSTKPVDPDEGNVSLALTIPDRVQGERAFHALGDGGTIKMPLADAFWGEKLGCVQDRFGLEWFVSTP